MKTLSITGIGSLPHSDVFKAWEYVFRHDLLWLPQLPNHKQGHFMLEEFEALGTDPNYSKRLIEVHRPFLKQINGCPFKCQMVGPWTYSNYSGKKDLKDSMDSFLTLIENFILPLFRETTATQKIFFLDEPFFEKIPIEEYCHFLNKLKNYDLRLGVHCCNQFDFGKILKLKLDYFSFDYQYWSPQNMEIETDGNFPRLWVGFDPQTKKIGEIELFLSQLDSPLMSYSCGLYGHPHKLDRILQGLKKTQSRILQE